MSRPDPACRPLVIGVGNRHRGDDAVGPHVAELVRSATAAADTMVIDGDLSALPLSWEADQEVVVVDAMASGRAAGTIEVMDGLTDDVSVDRRPVSSHGIGLADAIGLARVLGRLPRELTVVLIEGAGYGHLEPLSPEVEAAGRVVARRLVSGDDLHGTGRSGPR